MDLFGRRKIGYNNLVDRSYVVYDVEGKVIPKYSEIIKIGENLFKVKLNGLYGLVDQEDRPLLDCIYQEIYPFVENMARVKREDKYGFISGLFVEVIPCEFSKANDFKNGLAKVCHGSVGTKFIKADRKTQIALVQDFDDVSDVVGGLVQIRGQYGSTFMTDENKLYKDGKKYYDVTNDGKYWYGEADCAKYKFNKDGEEHTWEDDRPDSYSDYLRLH